MGENAGKCMKSPFLTSRASRLSISLRQNTRAVKAGPPCEELQTRLCWLDRVETQVEVLKYSTLLGLRRPSAQTKSEVSPPAAEWKQKLQMPTQSWGGSDAAITAVRMADA